MKRYLIQTFGCQMNVHDSGRLSDLLETSGYQSTDEAALADVIVVNTCSVREKAEHKLMSLLGRLRPLKEVGHMTALVVAGCVAQQEGERLLRRAPFVDLVIGPDNIGELPQLLEALEVGAPSMVRTVFDTKTPQFLSAGARVRAEKAKSASAYVTIMKGCDERCTYCVVPYTRGPERYRPANDIVSEISRLVAGGIDEITLLGQTVNSWYEPGSDEAGVSQFANLLWRIAREVPQLKRLRYTSPHPRHITPELVRAHAEIEMLAPHVHLPAQSGSNRVLKRMLRRYTREQYLERVAALRSARPGLTISTDLIVGFPGETLDDFDLTLSLIQESGFESAFAFKYSQRPHTPALKLEDNVPEGEKEERLEHVLDLTGNQQAVHLAKRVGTLQSVLVESKNKGSSDRFMGRNDYNEIVHFDGEGRDLLGEWARVQIIEANRHSLMGTLVQGTSRPRMRARDTVRLPLIRGPEIA